MKCEIESANFHRKFFADFSENLQIFFHISSNINTPKEFYIYMLYIYKYISISAGYIVNISLPILKNIKDNKIIKKLNCNLHATLKLQFNIITERD